MAEVPATTSVYLAPPVCLLPAASEAAADHLAPDLDLALAGATAVAVRTVAQRADTVFHSIPVRHTERGLVQDPMALRRVWTLHENTVAEEWLVIRQHSDGRLSYALSNAPADTPQEYLAWLKCVRHFVERTNQDSKSEDAYASIAPWC